ncbi:hypothetical protein ElyMa_005661300 [Elysia marginata]|uniref:Tc1-like transposase DDE domain-containing protein n=1 Tax=Elysia marginata TaxID=1093978 RepID=A0AAV4FCT8_9GAST|nr:hypothetical protein ElyMa_005661300 [Elysia marginata]
MAATRCVIEIDVHVTYYVSEVQAIDLAAFRRKNWPLCLFKRLQTRSLFQDKRTLTSKPLRVNSFVEPRQRRPETSTLDLMWHIDNVKAYTATETVRSSGQSNAQILNLCPHSSDLTPCDFFLISFVKMKA